jgi:hypothetical protein
VALKCHKEMLRSCKDVAEKIVVVTAGSAVPISHELMINSPLVRRTGSGQVAHFSGGAGFGFAVEVEVGARLCGHGGPVGFAVGPEVAEEVLHYGGGVLGNVAKV